MKVDNEQQRGVLLQLIQASQFPGSALDHVYQLRQAILSAEIEPDKKPKDMEKQGTS